MIDYFSGGLRSRRDAEMEDLWKQIDAIDITIPNTLIRPDRNLPTPNSNDDALFWGLIGGAFTILSLLLVFCCIKKLRK